MVVGEGIMPVLAGIVVGLGGAIGAAQFICSMLFATDSIDLPTLLAVGGLFLSVALVACIVPGWRAAKIDPISALRQE